MSYASETATHFVGLVTVLLFFVLFIGMCRYCANLKPGSCDDIKNPIIRKQCWSQVLENERKCREGESAWACL